MPLGRLLRGDRILRRRGRRRPRIPGLARLARPKSLIITERLGVRGHDRGA